MAAPWDYIFNANAPTGDPSSYNALQMRQRIALAMLSGNKKGYPKTVGEGLTSIGDAIGDIGTMRRLEAQQAAYDAAIQKAGGERNAAEPLPAEYPSTPPPDRRTEAAPDTTDTEPPRRTAAIPDAQDTTDTTDTPIVRTDQDGRITSNVTTPDVAPVPEQAPVPTRSAMAARPPSVFPSPATASSRINPAALNLGSDAYRASPSVGANAAPWLGSAGADLQMYNPNTQGFGPPPGARAALDPAQASQLAMLTGTQGRPGPAYAPTASLDPSAGAVPRPSLASPDPAVRAAIARTLLQRTQPALGVPQPNPTLPAAVPPPPIGSLGSPVGAGNPTATDIPPMPVRLAQAQTTPAGRLYVPPALPPGMPPQVPPPGTPARPVPQPPAEPRVPVPNVTPPPIPQPIPKAPAQLEDERLLRQAELSGDPNLQKFYTDRVGKWEALRSQQDSRNLEAWKAQQQVYEQARTQAETYRLETPKRELELQKAEDERQQRQYQEVINRQLGGLSPQTVETNLKASQASIAGIPAATDSIKRARTLVDQMYHGPFADTETFLAKVMGSSGFPMDPRASATEQFKTAMAGVMAQSRKAIVGPGSQSEAELALLQKSTASDAKLTPETIRATLDAAERLNLKTALAHQQLVRRYAGETDPDRQGMVYGTFGVPTQAMVDMVPQSAVNKLFQYAQDPEAHKVFDDKFHTPGLSRQVLQLRRPQ